MFIRNVTNSCVPFYSKSRERIFICHKCHLSHLPVFSHLCFLIVYIHFWILRISYFTGIDHTPTNTLDENIFKDTNLGIQILLNENPYGFTDDFHLLKIFSSNMLVGLVLLKLFSTGEKFSRILPLFPNRPWSFLIHTEFFKDSKFVCQCNLERKYKTT